MEPLQRSAGRLLLLALFSKHPDIKVTLVNRSVDKAQLVLEDEMVSARGGQNAKVTWPGGPFIFFFCAASFCCVFIGIFWFSMRYLRPEKRSWPSWWSFSSQVASMDDMFDVMKECDVVFTATGSEAALPEVGLFCTGQ